MAKIIFIGDVVGKPGRKILREVLPQWKMEYQPDAVIVNVENLAHGKGVTLSTLAEIDELGIDCFTGGNHIFNKDSKECFEKYDKLIRPANYTSVKIEKKEMAVPGHGYYRFSKEIKPLLTSPFEKGEGTAVAPSFSKEGVGGVKYPTQQFLVINLNGQVFMEKQFDGGILNPFLALDRILTEQSQKGDIIIVDFHSEATSEKVAFGYYSDGRVTAVFGTHTHVPTADNRVLPKGTAFMSDAGMTGSRDGVIGVKYQNVLKKFLEPETKFKNELEEDGMLQINGVVIEIGDNQKATKIERVYQELV